MVSEDSGCPDLLVNCPVATATVHSQRQPEEFDEPLGGEVLTRLHRLDDVGEGEELELLGAQERLTFEERNYPFHEVTPSTHN